MSSADQKHVYFFSSGETDGSASMKDLLGGKGANLAEMTSLGLSVPPGFTISTGVCTMFNEAGGELPASIKDEVQTYLKKVESALNKKFGSADNPLLVSVRSGARVSMPGMMDTVLNLGLNEETLQGLAKSSDNEAFAWDSYRRFIQMYSSVVMGMNVSFLEILLEDLKEDKGYATDSDLKVEDLKGLTEKYKERILETTGRAFPTDPEEQLWGAISAVFQSWNTSRAKVYRDLHNIPEEWGTAVNVQSMVFGNMGEDSATGVAFTRNPSTGESKFYGEFLINAQGEDVVAGIRTPQPVTKEEAQKKGQVSLEEALPSAYLQLKDIYAKLEKHYKDMQDIEFTIENGQLWMLQTRTGKRTASAALKIACDMIDEGLISEEEALLRVDPNSLDQLLHPRLDPEGERTRLAKGLPASPGGAVGEIVFSSEDSVKWKADGKKSILVRIETSPDDIEGMISSEGILTTRGGMTSHAAVVARGMGKCCVAGCAEAQVDYNKKELSFGGQALREGDVITLDGSTGEIFLGEIKTIPPQVDGNFKRFMEIADRHKKLGVRTNADNAKDTRIAHEFGAEGIGLCRTEHMFFGAERIDLMREMIMADTEEERVSALNKIEPFQRDDFKNLFLEMIDLPVTIRLLDPPLHEFLPHDAEEIASLSERLGWNVKTLAKKVKSLTEFNPMLGHRGCRLAMTYPEVYKMQARAIAEAACDVISEGQALVPEIMIPLVAVDKELEILRKDVIDSVEAVQKERGTKFDYLVGTMIELPRAALTADQIANHADFFSFGTNDLTQTCLGLSRDDAGKFLGTYVSEGVFKVDPFQSIDVQGVGALVKIAKELGRKVKPDIKLGICGEHGGDPNSIEFFHSVGLDYVSCSPYRVPIARLAAAQSNLRSKMN